MGLSKGTWSGEKPLLFWRAFFAFIVHVKASSDSHFASSAMVSNKITLRLWQIQLLNSHSAGVVTVYIPSFSFIACITSIENSLIEILQQKIFRTTKITNSYLKYPSNIFLCYFDQICCRASWGCIYQVKNPKHTNCQLFQIHKSQLVKAICQS